MIIMCSDGIQLDFHIGSKLVVISEAYKLIRKPPVSNPIIPLCLISNTKLKLPQAVRGAGDLQLELLLIVIEDLGVENCASCIALSNDLLSTSCEPRIVLEMVGDLRDVGDDMKPRFCVRDDGNKGDVGDDIKPRLCWR